MRNSTRRTRSGARAPRRKREPGVVRKMIAVLYEDAKRKRALRLLERQAWGLEFISMALVKACQHVGEGLVLTIVNKDGGKIMLDYDAARRTEGAGEMDSSIFMRLDDDLAVERFIRENSRR